jgi:hypothetical protein
MDVNRKGVTGGYVLRRVRMAFLVAEVCTFLWQAQVQ